MQVRAVDATDAQRILTDEEEPGQPDADFRVAGYRAVVDGSAVAATPTQRFIGRTGERTLLRHLLRDAGQGQLAIVVVYGVPGAGKTALLEWTADTARRGAAEVLWASGYEGSLPLAAVSRLVAPFRELTDVLRTAGPSGVGSGPLDTALGASATSDLPRSIVDVLVSRAHRRPLVVLLDDVQDLGDASRAVLSDTLVGLDDTGARQRLQLLVVLSARSPVESESLAGRAMRLHAARTLTLGGFDDQETFEFIAAAGRRPHRAQVRELREQTGGLPLLIESEVQRWRAPSAAYGGRPARYGRRRPRADHLRRPSAAVRSGRRVDIAHHAAGGRARRPVEPARIGRRRRAQRRRDPRRDRGRGASATGRSGWEQRAVRPPARACRAARSAVRRRASGRAPLDRRTTGDALRGRRSDRRRGAPSGSPTISSAPARQSTTRSLPTRRFVLAASPCAGRRTTRPLDSSRRRPGRRPICPPTKSPGAVSRPVTRRTTTTTTTSPSPSSPTPSRTPARRATTRCGSRAAVLLTRMRGGARDPPVGRGRRDRVGRCLGRPSRRRRRRAGAGRGGAGGSASSGRAEVTAPSRSWRRRVDPPSTSGRTDRLPTLSGGWTSRLASSRLTMLDLHAADELFASALAHAVDAGNPLLEALGPIPPRGGRLVARRHRSVARRAGRGRAADDRRRVLGRGRTRSCPAGLRRGHRRQSRCGGAGRAGASALAAHQQPVERGDPGGCRSGARRPSGRAARSLHTTRRRSGPARPTCPPRRRSPPWPPSRHMM